MKKIEITARLILSTALALVWLSVAGCARNDELPASVTQAYEQAITKDDLGRALALFTDDAQILPQHGPVVTGREEIERYLKDQMTPVMSFNTETDMTLVRDDIAVEQGHYRVRNIRRGSDIEAGKYVHVWRNVRGVWKLYRVIYNTDIAPDTEVSIAAAESEP